MTLASLLIVLNVALAANSPCLVGAAELQLVTADGNCESLAGSGRLDVSPGEPVSLVWRALDRDDVLVLDKHPAITVTVDDGGEVLDALRPRAEDLGLNYYAVAAVVESDQPSRLITIHARSGFSARYQISSAGEFRSLDLSSERWSIVVLATLAVMTVVNLFAFIVLRERAFAAYVCYIGSMLLFFSMDEGRAYGWPLIEHLRALGLGGVWAMGMLTAFFVVAFARAFAELDYFVPRLSGVLTVAQWGALVLGAIALFPAAAAVRPLLNLYLATFSVLIIVAAWVAWRGGSRYAGYFLLGWVPLTAVTVLLALNSEGWLPGDHGMRSFHRVVAALEAILFSLGLADKALRYRHERDSLLSLSERDELTGVRNRRGLQRAFSELADAARMERRPLSILFCDIDHFKTVNDRYGHDVGDDCLRFVSDVIGRELRGNDVCGRQGGEEFLALLPYADLGDALAIAERIRKRVRARPVRFGDHEVSLTISIGAAQAGEDFTGDFDKLIRRADQAMYSAKQRGRDRVATLEGVEDELANGAHAGA